MSTPPFLIGIDLGTTNSAVAYVDTRRSGGRVQRFGIPQLTEPSLVETRSVLPSFLYFADAHEIASGALALPWNSTPDAIAGVLARERGALAPARQIASAKSWLAHPGVDRRAAILPWGADSSHRISPVEASARYLKHIRDAWNGSIAAGSEDLRFERQRIVLAVPASFDEEARELTVEAAREASFDDLTLIEEPIAAFYAWASVRRRPQRSTSTADRPPAADSKQPAIDGIALVCDVGGGTTDFSLIRVRTNDGVPDFERIAVGDHLLLGGDNVDLALATVVERHMTESRPDMRLAITQRSALSRSCAAAKEQMLGDGPTDRVPITVLGTGRGVIGGSVTVELTRQDVEGALQQFLPITPAGQTAEARDRRIGLRELGLPYEGDPAITRHLAGFLARSAEALRHGGNGDVVDVGGRAMVRPRLLLFNGGFFTPAPARERIVEALSAWFGDAPVVLPADHLDAAVAIGAATYARLRAGIGPPMSLVRAGSARAYYVGLRAAASGETMPAVCVLARGTDEGTGVRLDHPFTVIANRPVSFSLYSSVVGTDRAGDLVTLMTGSGVHEHAPLVTVLRYGRKSRQVELPVRLSITFTELGTLELWCESQVSEHRWRLQFQLRSRDEEAFDGDDDTAPAVSAPEYQRGGGASAHQQHQAGAARLPDRDADVVVPDSAIEAGERAIRDVFESADRSDVTAENVVARLEQILGFDKSSWPLPALRRFVDVLIAVAGGRRASPALEARWLNLFGFCFRPGFGAAKDPWRIGEARAIYTSGLTFPNATQNRVEWLVLWQRVAGGFSGGQQRELAQRIMGDLGLLGRKATRLNPQIERESWRLVASLERLDAGMRSKIGDELMARVRRDARNAGLLWAIGRTGARMPLYGPLSSVVPPQTASRWIEGLSAIRLTTPDLAAAIVQIGARTGDPLRDVDEMTLTAARKRLGEAGVADEALRHLESVLPSTTADMNRVFGEPLPDGLKLESKTHL